MRTWASGGLLAAWLLGGCAHAPVLPVAVAPDAAPSVSAELPSAAPADLYITEPPSGIVRVGWWRWLQGHVLYPIQQGLDVTQIARTLTGRPRPALDMVEGYVADSSFFTNRDPGTLTPDEVRWGPVRPNDLPVPPLMLEGLRSPGRAPGFFVADARGNHYLFTVDFPDFPELTTAAEVVAGKLLYALGYNVFGADIYVLHPADVQPGPPIDSDLPEHAPGTLEDVERLLAPRLDARGRVRVAATQLPDEGIVVGSFSFKRYQHYAALRALRIAAAWLNNLDAGELQTLMTWDGHVARGYLVDLGSSLGSNVHREGPKAPRDGWGYAHLWSLATLGLNVLPYDPQEPLVSPAVGRLTVRCDPRRWSPWEPNIAFDQMTDADARWMARRIAALSPVQLAAAVAAGQYQHPEDAQVLLDILRKRQAAIRRIYLGQEESLAPRAAAAPASVATSAPTASAAASSDRTAPPAPASEAKPPPPKAP